MLTDDDWIERERQLRTAIFKNVPEEGKKEASRKSDLDHLLGHMHSGNDIFVTRDCPILDAKQLLSEKFKLTVMQPAEAVQAVLNEGKKG